MEMILENIKKIWLTEEAVCIETKDGNTGKELFADYPALASATPEQRKKYTTSAFGIHWEEIDEDLSFEGFFKPKTESSDLGKIFAHLQELNISAFARKLKIPQPLMAAYIKGTKKPGKSRKKEIQEELHRLGKQLQEISF